ncbi:MAG TPA: hypothetical protein VHP34_11430 [Alphaproteobacteria bacterium]|nr:hypothetical protein [Alphaproteobacteria bacterium]
MTVNVDTLGKAAKHGFFLHVKCTRCGKESTFFARDLLVFYVPDCPLDRINFKCERCDQKNTEVMAFQVCRDRSNRKQLVWRLVEM